MAAAMLAGGIVATLLLRRAWRSREDAAAARRGGWAIMGAVLAAAAAVDGARGFFMAACVLPVAALAVVAAGAEVRPARAARAGRESLAPEPADRTLTGWQRTLRWLLAGPMGLVAAMAVGFAWSTWVPGAPQTRLAVGGLLVPVLWGGAMAWTLADDRILRATAVLVGTAVAGFTVAVLKGFA